MTIDNFWLARFIFEWLIWLTFADKSRWREIMPVCIFASFVSLLVDQICELLGLWQYLPNDTLADLINAIGIYLIVTYLFIQYLPEQRTILSLFKYFFFWTAAAITVEFIHVYFGYMKHETWNFGFSYISNWLLFCMFYTFHRTLKLSKLN